MNILRSYLEHKKVVLLGNVAKDEFEEWNIFQNLADLIDKCEKEKYCYDLMRNFNVSLQGRQRISLEQLTSVDTEIAKSIGIQELFKMSQTEYLPIGKQKQELPNLHIPRTVSAIFMNTEQILNFYEQTENIAIIINCDKTLNERFLGLHNINLVEMSQYLNDENNQEYEKFILLSSTDKCTILQFEQVCRMSKKSNVYLLQVCDGECCFLLLQTGKKWLFNTLDSNKVVQEANIFDYFSNPLNVFCAPPGMGKSTLLKVLNNSSPPESWTVHVDLINYNSFLAEEPNFETIWHRFLELSEAKQDPLIIQIKNIFWKNKKMQLFLDGLDEVDSKYVNVLIDFVKYVSSQGVNVWISSRENLREKISQSLYAIPIEIKQLTRKQQCKFIHEKLRKKYKVKEIEEIITAVFNSADITNSQELLGIPLQLHIITEMFLNSEEAYTNLKQQNIFVLTQMYKLFFEGKKKSALKKLGIEQQETQIGFNFEHQLEQYEIPALKACLDYSDFKKLCLEERNTSFIHQIKTNGDKYGIIKKINDNDDAIFDHQTYAEYFACVWFKKNCHKIVLLQDKIFSKRYENLRLMFDVMMAEKNPLHLAVIYKNIQQFEQHIKDIEIKDEGGRTALHLACSYGMKYPTTTKRRLNRECAFYTKIIEILVQECLHLQECDNLFNFNCLDYSVQSMCLYPIEKMLEKLPINYNDIKKTVYSIYKSDILAYYAAQLGYPNLLCMSCNDIPIRRHESTLPYLLLNSQYLLRTAIEGSLNDVYYTTPRKGNITVVEILLTNGANADEIYPVLINTAGALELACQNGYYDMFKVLIHSGAKCTNGNSIMHRTVEYRKIDENVINMLEDLSIDVNAKNDVGITALHLACQKGDVESAKVLLKRGADVNIVGNKDQSALHYATDSPKGNTEIIDLLIHNGANVDAQDENGTTALQIACKKGSATIAKILLLGGADAKIVDNEEENALHYTVGYWQENTDIINLLIHHGVSVDAQNKHGTTALHIVCKNDHVESAKLLIKEGAKVNLTDRNDNNALHYAMESWKKNSDITNLLINHGITVNAQNNEGATALHLACGKGYFENAQTLLEKGAGINIVDDHKENLLHYAARCQTWNVKTEMINLLINCGIDVNAQNNQGTTPLHLACQKGNTEMARILLAKGACVNNVNSEKKNALHYAVLVELWEYNLEIIHSLIKCGIDVNAQSDQGVTPLQVASQKGHFEIAKTLLIKGADVNIADNKNNSTLHYAYESKKKNTDVILLLSHAVDQTFPKNQIRNALQFACHKGQVDIAKILIEGGVDINTVNNEKKSALHYAVESPKHNSEVVNLLLNHGIDVNSQSNKGTTPLQLACRKRHLKIVKKLLIRGADVRLSDFQNNNVLHYASRSRKKNSEIIHFLMDCGVSEGAKNSRNQTPLHIACKVGNVTTVEMLLNYRPATKSKSSLLVKRFRKKKNTQPPSQPPLDCKIEINVVDDKLRTLLHYVVLANRNQERLVNVLINSGINVKAQDLKSRNALDYAITKEYYLVVRMMIGSFSDNLDATFLYYSVYCGYFEGVELFKYVGIDIRKIDHNNATFPLFFAVRNGDLQIDLLMKMTKFIDKVIECFGDNSCEIKYSRRGLIEYLKYQLFLGRRMEFVFSEVDDSAKFQKTICDFKDYLRQHHQLNNVNFDDFSAGSDQESSYSDESAEDDEPSPHNTLLEYDTRMTDDDELPCFESKWLDHKHNMLSEYDKVMIDQELPFLKLSWPNDDEPCDNDSRRNSI